MQFTDMSQSGNWLAKQRENSELKSEGKDTCAAHCHTNMVTITTRPHTGNRARENSLATATTWPRPSVLSVEAGSWQPRALEFGGSSRWCSQLQNECFGSSQQAPLRHIRPSLPLPSLLPSSFPPSLPSCLSLSFSLHVLTGETWEALTSSHCTAHSLLSAAEH